MDEPRGGGQTLAFVVPTRNRAADLRRMLASIAAGTRLPDQLVVVDGSDAPLDDVGAEFPTLPIELVRVYPPSLSKQRNAGMARLRPEITLAGYLDDDLVLEPAAIEAMLRFWESAGADVGGAAFNITNVPRPGPSVFKTVFQMEANAPGIVRRSGYHSMICPVSSTIYVDWLFGGATVWRRSVIGAFPYDEWFQGTGFLEDVEYSFRVSRHHRLAVVADARLEHLSPPIRPDRQFLLGKWQVVNRLYFVRKYSELSVAHWAWALVGQLMVNGARGVLTADRGYIDRFRGNVAGLGAVSMGGLQQVDGILK